MLAGIVVPTVGFINVFFELVYFFLALVPWGSRIWEEVGFELLEALVWTVPS